MPKTVASHGFPYCAITNPASDAEGFIFFDFPRPKCSWEKEVALPISMKGRKSLSLVLLDSTKAILFIFMFLSSTFALFQKFGLIPLRGILMLESWVEDRS
jgi:hypothetical protein